MLEYKVISEASSKDFEKAINRASKEGWALASQFSVDNGVHYVMMAKKKEVGGRK